MAFACTIAAMGCAEFDDADYEDSMDGGMIGLVSEELVEPATEVIGLADYRWSVLTSEANVRLLEDQGYRLFRIEADQTSPTVLFSALFVKNVGAFRQLGAGWSTNLTQNQVQAIANDSTRRLIDLAPYSTSAGIRYAVVWVGNTGAQHQRYRVVFNGVVADLTAACADVVTGDSAPPVIGRVTDIEFLPTTARWNAIVVEAEPGTLMREPGNHNPWQQHIGSGTLQQLQEMLLDPIYGGPLRVVAIEPTFADSFAWILEKTTEADKFKSWVTGGMQSETWGTWGSADTIQHFEKRMNARPIELKPYTDSQGIARYVGIFTQLAPAALRGKAPKAALPAKFITDVDDAMQSALERYRLPGGAVAVTAGGKLIYARGYGHQDIDFRQLADPDDRYRIASVSKTITAIAIMKMIEEGHPEPNCLSAPCPAVSLATRPFESVFNPRAPAGSPLRTITLAHLLEHTSGAKESVRWMLHAQQWIGEPAPLEVIPGFFYAYANGGYAILGEVIENVVPPVGGSGIPTTYQNYVQSRLLNPLGIQRIVPSGESVSGSVEVTHYENTDRLQRVAATKAGDPVWIRESAFPSASNPDSAALPTGSWAASPIDMLRLIAGIDRQSGTQIFQAGAAGDQTYTQMWSSTAPPPGLVPGAGHAFGFDSFRQPTEAGFKGGYLPGSANAGLHFMDNGVRIMWMFNGDGTPRSAANGEYIIRGGTHGDPLFFLHMKPKMEEAGECLGSPNPVLGCLAGPILPATVDSWDLGFSQDPMCPAYDPYANVASYCTANCPCESGQGDCDNDAQCGGGLRCVYDVGGASYGDPARDSCYLGCPVFSFASLNGELCSTTCPCGVGEGDCDSSSECSGSLVCTSNNGARFGMAPSWDVCTDPACPAFNAGTATATHCTRDCPCGIGEGGCTTNLDCAQELVCQTGIATQFGLPSSYGVCQRPLRFEEPIVLQNASFAGYLTAAGGVPSVTGSGSSPDDQFALVRVSGSTLDVWVNGDVVALRHIASGKYLAEAGSGASLVTGIGNGSTWRLLRDGCGCVDGSRVVSGATTYWLEAILGGDRLKANSTGVARVVSGAGGYADWRIHHAAP